MVIRAHVLAAASFRYALQYRPLQIGAVPKGYVHYEPDGGDIERARHGILTYDRQLTDAEVKQYELVPLSGDDGHPLESPRIPAAVLHKVEEAINTLNYVHDENIDEADAGEVLEEARNAL